MWWSKDGTRLSYSCGILEDGKSLLFEGVGLRQATTTDLDATSMLFVQFTIMVGCSDQLQKIDSDDLQSTYQVGEPFPSQISEVSPREEGILIQCSVTGGIHWILMKEIHYTQYVKPRFVNINLEDFPDCESNATRFRFWQPSHPPVLGEKSWAIDDLYIGGTQLTPDILYDNFQEENPNIDAWINHPGGRNIEDMCSEDSHGGRSIVFEEETYTGNNRVLASKDIALRSASVIQFDIKIGCSDYVKNKNSLNNISLEFSNDFGSTWEEVKSILEQDRDYLSAEVSADSQISAPGRYKRNSMTFYEDDASRYNGNPSDESRQSGAFKHGIISPDCLHELRSPSVYYWNSAPIWRREVSVIIISSV